MVNRKEISERTGVSMTVISHVLNNTPGARVKTETREKVLRVARELGYVTNALGKALIENKIHHVALAINCCDSDDDQTCKRIISGVTAAAAEQEYHVLLCPLKSRMDDNLASDLAELVQSRRVDGLILNKEDVLTAEVAKLAAMELPLVLINNHFTLPIDQGHMLDSFCPDLFGGTRIATNLLITRGHRRIALFRSENGVFARENHRGSDQRRESGYLEALNAADIPIDRDLIAIGDFSRTGDIEQAARVLAQLPQPPTAVIAATDAIALKALHYLRSFRVEISPDAVVGGGDLFFRRYLEQPFHSLALPWERMGRMAFEQIKKIIDRDAAMPGTMTVLPVTLVDQPFQEFPRI